MAKEQQYTAEDGLKILEYLGITNLTGQERQIFKCAWSGIYQAYKKELMMHPGHLTTVQVKH